jgi:hypothetical protein
MTARTISRLLLLLLCIPQRLPAHQPEVVRQLPIYYRMAQELLTPLDTQLVDYDQLEKIGKDEAVEERLSRGQRRSIVFKLFAQHGNTHLSAPFHIVDTDGIRSDLEFSRFYAKYLRTTTVFGDVVFSKVLAQPTDDRDELIRRQTIVKRLVEDEALFNHCMACLKEIKASEPFWLSFFSDQNNLRQQALSWLYFDKNFWQMAGVYDSQWDKSPKKLLASDMLLKAKSLFSLFIFFNVQVKAAIAAVDPKHFVAGVTLAGLLRFKPELMQKISPLLVLGGTVFALNKLHAHIKNGPAAPIIPDFRLSPEEGAAVILSRDPEEAQAIAVGAVARDLAVYSHRLNEFNNSSRLVKEGKWFNDQLLNGYKTYSQVEGAVFAPITLYMEWRNAKVWRATMLNMQKKFMRLSGALKRMKSINNSLMSCKNMVEIMPELNPLIDLFEHPELSSEDMKALLGMLQTPTFKGKPSIFSHTGRIAATNKLMDYAKYDWARVFEAIGHLDLYVATATLVKEFQSKGATICFTDYLKAEKPVIKVVDFWNPLVTENVVVNSFELGSGVAGNAIITGPNTGGKSTVIKGIFWNSLAAQTLGIAFAKECHVTPFAAYNTYINIADDITHNRSLFANEVYHAKKLFDSVVTLRPDQFCLTIIDEMFRGTAPDQAAVLSHQYATEFGKQANSMLLQATHYKELINLEKETNGLYQNYMVEIEHRSDGSLYRPYLLKKGATTQNVAADILKEQGLFCPAVQLHK